LTRYKNSPLGTGQVVNGPCHVSGNFLPFKESLIQSPAKQLGFSPLQKGKKI
jgi:hypothetical protein